MRVVLINPPLYRHALGRLKPIVDNLFYNSAPLGLGYLAGVLEGEMHDVMIIDAAAEGLSIAKVVSRISDFSPDVAGITTNTISTPCSYELAKQIKDASRGAIKVVVGGPHITSNPLDLLQHRQLDAAVLGEGEITFKELLVAMEKGRGLSGVKGLAYYSGGEVVFTPPREYIADLDSLAFPARHLLPMHLYRPQPNDQKRLPKLSMITSRGCPYGCIFCDKNVFKNNYRSFSPEYIAAEMAHLVKEYKARDIAFVDSTFTPNRERVYAVIKKIKESDLDVTWTCSVRVDVLDEQLLRSMKEAGCWRVRLGIESGNEEVLKFIRKGVTRAQVRKVADWAYELDLEPKGFFMVGHLTDTKQTIQETIDFALSLPLKDITVQVNTPLKGTAQYDIMDKYGDILTKDVSCYNFWEPVFLPSGITQKELRHYYSEFYLRFYLRPRVWYRHLIKIRSIADIFKYLRGMKVIFFFLAASLNQSKH